MTALPPISANLLQHMLLAQIETCYGKQPIVKVLEVSQGISQTLGGSFESKCIYPSLLKAILLHLSHLM